MKVHRTTSADADFSSQPALSALRTRMLLAPALRPVIETMERRVLLSSIPITLDPTFGTGGQVLEVNTPVAGQPTFMSGQAVAEMSNGQTLVAGSVTVKGKMGVYVRRYRVNGTVDTSFAAAGGFAGQSGYAFVGPAVNIDLSGRGPSAVGLKIDSKGRVLVGEAGVGIFRLTSNGRLDATFGVKGSAAITQLGDFLVEPNGLIVAAAPAYAGTTVTRLTASGLPDTSFGVKASVLTPVHTMGPVPNAPLAAQADGKILVGGTMEVDIPFPGFPTVPKNNDLAVARLNANGSLDTSFGSAGVATADFYQFDDFLAGGSEGLRDAATATALAVRPNGNIIAGGITQQENTSLYGQNFGTAAEFLPSGKLNPAFQNGGELAPFGSTQDTTVTDVIVQNDGNFVLTGKIENVFQEPNLAASASFYIKRYNAAGVATDSGTTLDSSSINESFYRLLDAAMAPNGKLVVVGSVDSPAGSGFDVARYILQAGSISGTVFNDLNANGNPETSEPKVSGRTVYIDTNNNGKLDAGEVKTTTDAKGKFAFVNLQPGTYNIREVLPGGWRQTAPNGNGAARVVSLGVGQDTTIMQMGATQAAVITGKIYNDLNSNGVFDATEKGLSYWQVYIDKNNNGVWDKGEFIVNANSKGNYTMVIKPGTYRLREVRQNGWTRTQPPGVWPAGYYDVTVAAGQLVTARDFGNHL